MALAPSPSKPAAAVFHRRLVIAAYTVVFWLLLPAGLIAGALGIDAAVGLHGEPRAAGLVAFVPGLVLVFGSIRELWVRGGGLPLSALPPPRLVTSGPYRLFRHPIYLGWNLAVFGFGLLIGSGGLAFVIAPALLPAWVLYALLEERSLVRRFGAAYVSYRNRVGLFVTVDLYRLARLLVGLGVFRVTVEGAGNIPRNGPVAIVSNHACYLDPVFLTRVTPRTIWFTSTAEVFRKGIGAFLFRRIPVVPLRRYRADPAACRRVLELLAEGQVIGLFPEGERSPHGGRQAALPAVSRLIARLPCAVVPVAIVDSADVGPRWSGSLRRRPVTVRVGPPLRLDPEQAAAQIEAAWSDLMPDPDQRVHLAGLDLSRLSRVLWRCPSCGDEPGFQARVLTCDSCGARWMPTEEGQLRDTAGGLHPLASLARTVEAMPERAPLRARVAAFRERSMLGPIRPLEACGIGELVIHPDRLEFGDVIFRLSDILSVTTESANVLQVATSAEMWQFRTETTSVFRLKSALERWSTSGAGSAAACD